MIIVCVNCNKKFNVAAELIPDDGRKLKCGSCDHSWHFKLEKSFEKTIVMNDEIIQENIKLPENKKGKKKILIGVKSEELIKNIEINDTKNINKNTIGGKMIKNTKITNFFSYLLVIIISFIALIILVDTLKSPLIDIFPELEIFLFSLFETLKDVKLFIIDLT